MGQGKVLVQRRYRVAAWESIRRGREVCGRVAAHTPFTGIAYSTHRRGGTSVVRMVMVVVVVVRRVVAGVACIGCGVRSSWVRSTWINFSSQ